MTLRPNAEIAEINSHLVSLKKATWISGSCRWWPDYLFHCTDIQNVVNILRHGELLSRTGAKGSNKLQVDIASSDIISQTDSTWYEYARLYFGPRTPTHFRNEGFRPIGSQVLKAHCPVPVYLLFRALPVLSRLDCLFTDGNLARKEAIPVGDVESFQNLPFNLIYHRGFVDPEYADRIIYHRNAEVLIPKYLDLDALSLIVCRSQAEYQTLLHLLPPRALIKWVDKIGVLPDLHLFHNRWTFVDQADLSKESLLFKFNQETETPGPFEARIELIDSSTGATHSWQENQYFASSNLHVKLPIVDPQDYTISLLLDNQLAYAGRYQEDELPF